VVLSAARDVELRDKHYLALSEWPWLRAGFNGPPPAGRWIRLTYAASLLDPLARPVVRCFMGNTFHDEILPAALFGRAHWYGLVPEGTKEIWISPTNRPGLFGFAIESMEVLSNGAVIRRCLRQNPHHALIGMAAQLIGLRYAASVKFHRAISATRLGDYGKWRKSRFRELDLTGLDAPRFPWERGPNIRFVTGLDAVSVAGLRSLASELSAQPYPRWTLATVAPADVGKTLLEEASAVSERVIIVRSGATAHEILEGLSDGDVIAPIAPADLIPAYALAVLAEAANQFPAADVFYGDEEFIDSKGEHTVLRLRPDWSPALWSACPNPFIGTAVFFRAGMLKRLGGGFTAADFARAPHVTASNALSQHAVVSHIRRVMLARTNASADCEAPQQRPAARSALTSTKYPCATIIIPTKDRCDLLTRCVESLKRKTTRQDIEVMVIDNGSEQASARRLLAELARDRRFRVLSQPGPFNFSRLCNNAAAEAKASTLVFLNNDTEIIDGHWLEPLLYWAGQSDVGAVGAKLLYPNGRVQHAGVALGIDGRAGHFERMLARDDPGYFGRLCVPHEVSTVTAACLAVDKRKFDAVGGFDAVNLPIELNDMDLCLRLLERGWKAICAADCVLIHHESASRGRTARADEVYKKERSYFRARWMHHLRDDRYFHPALSLHSLGPALG
jgi:GT2 family glycosyltransferase